ncbi:HPr kinase/phosphorylase [Reyranella sp.]|uniref:HPr kinase/phosphorylase n=1 Tax=Reyranella sp. TaxID=1929291 RepID=UPI00271B53EA|nr:HPr kinase/phosphatase C-terminal domain-containing protein [Reyranella sp.]MDO8975573.1 HPr kinase/phosphatase C-terminal domain-containing protein [Reyranella sp.]MDP3240869.1 HPr kinase/phosphatase C-terminal domain-containing protein [Reyranella sp.]
MAIRVTTYVHATCVALRAGRNWRGILLRGPSGAGKSDLALRLVEGGSRLVADDQTALVRQGRGLVATPPGTLAGLLEVRGVGIVKLGRAQLLARATIVLLVDLVPPDRIERLPDRSRETLLGVDLPVVALAPFEASAPAKLRLALARTAAA